MKKVIIKGREYDVIPHSRNIGSVKYKGTEYDICFTIEGYYIMVGKTRIPVEFL